MRTFLLLLSLLLSLPALAEVDRIEVLERGAVADGQSFGAVGPYERLRGRLHFSVDPAAPENRAIVDLARAPKDARGRVTFAADFVLLMPADPARGNGRILYEVVNRGSGSMLSMFNNAMPSNWPATAAQTGTGFLMEQGYSLLWSGWDWNLPPGADRLRAELPIATEAGKPLTGLVEGEVTLLRPATSAPHTGLTAVGYEPLRPDDPDARLMERTTALGPRALIPRQRWQFGRAVDGKVIYDPGWITLEGGFQPGVIYTVTYAARNPRVMGLGLAAIRDALLFFRHSRTDGAGNANPLTAAGGELPKNVLAFGHSQSARVMQTMIADGLVADGQGRLAFDGALLNVAGSGKGSFNYRFAQATRHFSPDVEMDFPTDWFPFSTAPQTDGALTASVLDRLPPGSPLKLFYVNTSTEYWTRSASLTHTSIDGTADLAPEARARIYFIAGGQHRPNLGGARNEFAHCRNPLDYRPLMKALLLHLDAWVTLKEEPPPSAYPMISDGSLGPLQRYQETMPRIPGLRLPTRLLEPPRIDVGARFASEGIIDVLPPKPSNLYPVLVPQPDADGLDKGGIRLPAIAVPLGTYTGWNPQNADTGAPERLGRWDGSFNPFPRTEDERLAAMDPRNSIAERYQNRQAYTEAYAAATLALAENELILGADINEMVDKAGAFYDRLLARDPADEGCEFIPSAGSGPPSGIRPN